MEEKVTQISDSVYTQWYSVRKLFYINVATNVFALKEIYKHIGSHLDKLLITWDEDICPTYFEVNQLNFIIIECNFKDKESKKGKRGWDSCLWLWEIYPTTMGALELAYLIINFYIKCEGYFHTSSDEKSTWLTTIVVAF